MSFSSFCGIHIYTYFSRANLNTSCSCHSVPSLCPPQLTGRSAAALAPQHRLFGHYLTPKIELDKKVLSDLSYLPVLNSNKWIFLWYLSVPTWSVSCSFWLMVRYLWQSSSRELTPSLQGRNTPDVRRLLNSSGQLSSLPSVSTWMETE